MIRPLTVATFLMACGSGLYLYQSKHEVQLLDRTIEKTVHDTGALREQSRLLAAEWTMLNDPERLRQFSDTYLKLRSISPTQFTSLADLDGKLPAPQAEEPASGTDDQSVSLEASPDPGPEPTPEVVEQEALPVPPVPAARPAQPIAVARSSETKLVAARPVAVVEPRSWDEHPSDQRYAPRLAETRPEVRTSAIPAPRPITLAAPRARPVDPPVNVPTAPAPLRPTPVPAPVPNPAPYPGSLLGMARGSMPPSPRPTPVNATYNAN
jgi:hypothetical protein